MQTSVELGIAYHFHGFRILNEDEAIANSYYLLPQRTYTELYSKYCMVLASIKSLVLFKSQAQKIGLFKRIIKGFFVFLRKEQRIPWFAQKIVKLC